MDAPPPLQRGWLSLICDKQSLPCHVSANAHRSCAHAGDSPSQGMGGFLGKHVQWVATGRVSVLPEQVEGVRT
jgi:hypothetical protein